MKRIQSWREDEEIRVGMTVDCSGRTCLIREERVHAKARERERDGAARNSWGSDGRYCKDRGILYKVEALVDVFAFRNR
jgi:hypothetical protein